jgi:hypothetical protein
MKKGRLLEAAWPEDIPLLSMPIDFTTPIPYTTL